MNTERHIVTAEYLKSQGVTPSFPERFFSKVRITDSCWLWTASIGSWGYGCIGCGWDGGFIWRAHRASWMLHFGPIPKGMLVCHDCPGGDNPACVNPAHLWLGTNGDNIKDATKKLRISHGERHKETHLTERDIKEIIRLGIDGRLFYCEIGKLFGITDSTVSQIINRRTWKHVNTDGIDGFEAFRDRPERRRCPKQVNGPKKSQ